MANPPTLTPEQRQLALEKAAVARRQRAEVKDKLKIGSLTLRELFDAAEREAPGFAFVVRSMAIDFLKPARMDDVLEVQTETTEVKGASITVTQRIIRGEDLLVAAQVRVAFVSGGRARPIPGALRLAMRAEQARAGGRGRS